MTEATDTVSGDEPSRARRALTGAMVATCFGFAFFEANSTALHGVWEVLAKVAGAVLAVPLGVRIVAARRAAGIRFGRAASGAFGRRYRMVVLVEVVLLVAGLLTINLVSRHGALALPWVTFVVGVHFFGLGALWRARSLHLLAAVLAVLGVAGLVLAAVGASGVWIAVVSGFLPGLALLAAAASSLADHLRRPAAVAGQAVSPHGGA